MGKSSSYEANDSSVSQEIPHILWHTKVDLDVRKRKILECIMSYTNLVNVPTPLTLEPL